MAKSSWETTQEKEQMIAELKQLESTFAHSNIDWKKIKSQSADALVVTLSIVKRQVEKGLIALKSTTEKTQLDYILDYCDLGYDFSPTMLYGKEAVRMVKRYSHKAERKLMCEQIFHHSKLKDMERLRIILDFMYQDIQEQEKSGKYYESSDYDVKSN